MRLDLHFDPNEIQVVIRSGTSKILSLCLLFRDVAPDPLELPLASRHGGLEKRWFDPESLLHVHHLRFSAFIATRFTALSDFSTLLYAQIKHM